MARDGEVTEKTQRELMRSARAAGLYTEGANAPLQFHAQADVLVAPRHAWRASFPPKDEYAKAAEADAKRKEATKEAAKEAKTAEDRIRAETEKAAAVAKRKSMLKELTQRVKALEKKKAEARSKESQ
jgi:septin family protein